MPYFHGSAGRVFHDAWLPEGDVHAAAVLIHGYGEHLGLYDALARRLAADGVAVHGFDWVGHGRSEGTRAVVESWDHLVQDTRTLCAIVRAEHPGVPLVVIGHSGGGATAVLFALRNPTELDALVFSGAPVLRQDWIDGVIESGVEELDGGHPTEILSTHPDYVHELLHSPLTWKGGFRVETLRAIRDTWPELETRLPQGLPVPVLMVHGEEDQLVPVDHARAVAGHLDAELHVFPGDLHDVLNEHDRDAVHEVVAGFLAGVRPAPAAAVTAG
jgi:alpha-beta hydrolase superfamily lysophospholipase